LKLRLSFRYRKAAACYTGSRTWSWPLWTQQWTFEEIWLAQRIISFSRTLLHVVSE
jgi:hypothetical protein